MELVDTHCHLQFDQLLSRKDDVLGDAAQAGVSKYICVGTTLEDSEQSVSLASENSSVWAAVGVHPHDADSFCTDQNSAEKLKKLAQKPKVVAIGETGLDYYKNYSSNANQELTFRKNIEIALETGLPMIFHVREAWKDFWHIFDSYKNLSGVIHSFSSNSNCLDEALSRGLFIGLNGIMTFTKDQDQLEAAKKIPNDKLVLETDAPFLTPTPFRGKICEPKHVLQVAEFMSMLRGVSVEDLAKQSTANAVKLFNIGS